MDEVLKVHGYDKLTCENLLVIIKMWMDSEWDLFLTIKDWVNVDYEQRKQHLDILMSHVRFSLLTPAQLRAIKKMKMYSHGTWQNNVQVGEEYHSRPMHKKMMRPTSVRNKQQVVCFNDTWNKPQVVFFNDDDASCIFTLDEDGKWVETDVPEIPEFFLGDHIVLEFHNFLIIAADSPEPTWHIFDPSTFKWSKMKSTKVQRSNFALVHDDYFVYALGGCLEVGDSKKVIDTIERYDPATNTWTVMSSKLPKPLARHKACVCSGPFFSIYVAGGQNRLSDEGECSKALSCFSPYDEPAKWNRKAPMIGPINEVHIMHEMAIDGKDPAIIAACNDLVIQNYDLKTDQWSVVSCRANSGIDWRWHKNGTILSDPGENTLYILNILENFPLTEKNVEQGACGKCTLSKLNKGGFGCRLEKFPIQAGCWGYCASPNYVAAMLAIPAASKKRFATVSQSGGKSRPTSKAKRSNQSKPKS